MKTFILMDESGDLGFDKNKKNSNFFLITFIISSDLKSIQKIVKNTHASLRKKIKRLSGGILHAYKEKPSTRIKVLSRLKQRNIKVMTILLNKSRVYTRLHDEKHVLYNYVTNILIDRIMSKKLITNTSEIILIAEKRETNKFLNDNFKTYLENQTKNKHNMHLKVKILTPSEEKALQAVDFISWAIFRKYEKNDNSYYKIIETKFVEENILFSNTIKP